MRIDGGTKASSGQQAQTRFEQVMARELSRTTSGKTPTETNARTVLSTSSKKKSPGSERAGVSFKASLAAKVLKGMKDGARQVLSKTMALTGQTFKATFAKPGKAGDTTAGTGEKGLPGQDAASGKQAGDTAAKSALTKRAPTEAPSPAPSARRGTGPMASGQTAFATNAPGGETRTSLSGGERAAATAPAPAERALPAMSSPAAVAEASGAQEGRAAPATLDTATPQEALLLHGPGLQAVARKAKVEGRALSMIFLLGPNAHGAEFVSITTDDKGFITGPEVDIALTEGTRDTQGNWVALSGGGTLQGRKITLAQDEDGCAFVTDGEAGVPNSVTAWITGGEALRADIIAIRRIR